VIIFVNPGLIPLDAIRLMGASVKVEGAFGRFGTGFKYAVATIMRGGGTVRIWRGAEELRFSTRKVEMRGTTFEEVWLDRLIRTPGIGAGQWEAVPLGFTTQLGKDWEPWMALRELACNARDEGGDFKLSEMEAVPSCFEAKEGETVIVVLWPEMDEAAKGNEAGVFAPDTEPLAEALGVRILQGPSQYLYHRDVRVWKLPKPSAFTYDITAAVELTEDRTVKYSFTVVAQVRNALLALEDRDIIRGAVTTSKGRNWEGSFDWAGQDWAPSQPGQTWLEVVAEARNNQELNVSESARNVLLKHQAFRRAEAATWIDQEGANERLSDAAEVLEELGFKLKDVNVFITDALPGGALSAVNKGSVFLTPELLDARVVVIVRELIRRLLELQGGGDHDQLLAAAVSRLFDLAIGTHFRLKRERELFDEEARAGSVADALLIAMNVHGEEFPVKPSEVEPAPTPDVPF